MMERNLDLHLRFQRLVLRALIAAAVVFRLWYAGFRQLVPDEAFYWVLSRHLAGGYLDHPPMVAFLIRLSTLCVGSTRELGVRFFAVAASFGALVVMLLLCERIVKDRRATLLLLVMWLVSPLFAALGTLMTPDPPVFFFSGLALALAIAAVTATEPRKTFRRWLEFGICCGLALLSKYTAILLPASVVLALLFCQDGRRHLAQPGIYLAGIMALMVFWPVIDWNYHHDWVSFAYQLNHGLRTGQQAAARGIGAHFHTLGEYVGGQFFVWTPVLFVVGIAILVRAWRGYRGLNLPRQILLWSATLPLVFFGYASWRSRGEANWPIFAYFPLSLLTVDYLSSHWRSSAMLWTKIGMGVALVIAVFMQSPELCWTVMRKMPQPVLTKLHVERHLPRILVEVFGWREFGADLDMASEECPVVCTTHQDAGEAAFYMRGQPEAWVAHLSHSRPTSFDYFDFKPDIRKMPAVLLVGGDSKEFCQTYGFTVVGRKNWREWLCGYERYEPMALCVRLSTSRPATTQAAR